MEHDQAGTFPPPPPIAESCYRHPGVQTGVRCTRCSRPICPDCMIPAPVGHQCPTCVAEAKGEFRRGRSPRGMTSGTSARELPVTTGLLVSLFVVYLVEVALAGTGSLIAGPGPRKLVDLGAMVPLTPSGDGGALGVAAGQYWRLASSMFLHAGIIHLLMNAYGLWLFGSIEEQEMGSARLLMVYLFSGIVAAAASYAFSPLTVVAVGASGAIYGLLGAFVTYNYRRRHMRFFRARLQAVLPWIVLNLFLSFSIAFIDWRAHLAGLVAGGIAGFVAEGTGSQATRRAILVLGFAGLLAAAVALVAWRTADLRGQFPGL